MEEPNSVLEGQIQNSHLEDHITGIEHQTIEHEDFTNEYNSTTEVHNGPVKSDNENSTEIGNTANLDDSESHGESKKPVDSINEIDIVQDSEPTKNPQNLPDSKLTESPSQNLEDSESEAPKKSKNSYTRADMIDDLAILKTKVEQLSEQLAVFQARKMN